MFPIPIRIQLIDNIILNFLDNKSIQNLLITSKYTYNYYSNDNYWLYKVNTEFNMYKNMIYFYKTEKYSWLQYYFRLKKYLKLNLKLLCRSKCLDILKIKVETLLQENGKKYYYYNELLSPYFRDECEVSNFKIARYIYSKTVELYEYPKRLFRINFHKIFEFAFR